jgi:hypothetical protein
LASVPVMTSTLRAFLSFGHWQPQCQDTVVERCREFLGVQRFTQV